MIQSSRNFNAFYLLRIARGLSVKELAQELSVTPAYINAIEKGQKFPADRLLRDYAQALGVEKEVILNFNKEDHSHQKFEQVLLSILNIICKIPD